MSDAAGNLGAIHFHAGWNRPGYLPEAELGSYASFAEAAASLGEEMEYAARSTASWADEHDCDDIPCPTYGDDCPGQLAGDIDAAGEDLGEAEGPEWATVVAGWAWWVSPCAEADCAPDEEDDMD